MSDTWSQGNVPFWTNPERVLEAKILNAINAGGGGGGGTPAILHGAGAPVANPGVAATLYIDDNTGTLYEWYNGAWH